MSRVFDIGDAWVQLGAAIMVEILCVVSESMSMRKDSENR